MRDQLQGEFALPRASHDIGNGCTRPNLCFLYLCVHESEPRFKVVIANSPNWIFQGVPELSEINIEKSAPFDLSTIEDTVKVERALRSMLRPFRFQSRNQRIGSTEWFKLEAFGQAVALVEQRQRLLNQARQNARRDAQGFAASRGQLAAFNLMKVTAIAQLWWFAAAEVPLEIRVRGLVRSLVFRDARARLAPRSALRVALQDVDGTYGLEGIVQGPSMPSLVRLVAPIGNGDLRIDLQHEAVLARLPAGPELNALVRNCLRAQWQRMKAVAQGSEPPPTPNPARRDFVIASLQDLASTRSQRTWS